MLPKTNSLKEENKTKEDENRKHRKRANSKLKKKANKKSSKEANHDLDNSDDEHLEQHANGQVFDQNSEVKPAVETVNIGLDKLEHPSVHKISGCLPDIHFDPYPHPVFGIDLENLVFESSFIPGLHMKLPYIIKTSIDYLTNHEALTTEGLFTVSGTKELVKEFREMFDHGDEVHFPTLLSKDNILSVATLIVKFLKKLPDPLIPKLYDAQISFLVEEYKNPVKFLEMEKKEEKDRSDLFLIDEEDSVNLDIELEFDSSESSSSSSLSLSSEEQKIKKKDSKKDKEGNGEENIGEQRKSEDKNNNEKLRMMELLNNINSVIVSLPTQNLGIFKVLILFLAQYIEYYKKTEEDRYFDENEVMDVEEKRDMESEIIDTFSNILGCHKELLYYPLRNINLFFSDGYIENEEKKPDEPQEQHESIPPTLETCHLQEEENEQINSSKKHKKSKLLKSHDESYYHNRPFLRFIHKLNSKGNVLDDSAEDDKKTKRLSLGLKKSSHSPHVHEEQLKKTPTQITTQSQSPHTSSHVNHPLDEPLKKNSSQTSTHEHNDDHKKRDSPHIAVAHGNHDEQSKKSPPQTSYHSHYSPIIAVHEESIKNLTSSPHIHGNHHEEPNKKNSQHILSNNNHGHHDEQSKKNSPHVSAHSHHGHHHDDQSKKNSPHVSAHNHHGHHHDELSKKNSPRVSSAHQSPHVSVYNHHGHHHDEQTKKSSSTTSSAHHSPNISAYTTPNKSRNQNDDEILSSKLLSVPHLPTQINNRVKPPMLKNIKYSSAETVYPNAIRNMLKTKSNGHMRTDRFLCAAKTLSLASSKPSSNRILMWNALLGLVNMRSHERKLGSRRLRKRSSFYVKEKKKPPIELHLEPRLCDKYIPRTSHIVGNSEIECFHHVCDRLAVPERPRFKKRGARFFVLCKLFFLVAKHTSPPKYPFHLTWKEISWGLGANNIEVLLGEIFITQEDWTWNNTKMVGIPFSVKTNQTLLTITENVAKAQYLIRKNPNDCAIFYVLTGKLSFLSKLFLSAKGEDEVNTGIANFLQYDFNLAKYKTAALKNAYNLLSTHQYERAACFFLLAGEIKAAVSAILYTNEIHLATLIARLGESIDKGETYHYLLKNTYLLKARQIKDLEFEELIKHLMTQCDILTDEDLHKGFSSPSGPSSDGELRDGEGKDDEER